LSWDSIIAIVPFDLFVQNVPHACYGTRSRKAIAEMYNK
jgi:hypothetical protein